MNGKDLEKILFLMKCSNLFFIKTGCWNGKKKKSDTLNLKMNIFNSIQFWIQNFAFQRLTLVIKSSTPMIAGACHRFLEILYSGKFYRKCWKNTILKWELLGKDLVLTG